MARIGLAFKLFFRVLSDAPFAAEARRLIEGSGLTAQLGAPPEPARPAPAITESPAKKTAPARSDALTLLAVLQREARLVDFLRENIAPYDDAQVGAAVRDVHRGAAAALERLFAPRPVMSELEGSTVTVPSGADAGRIRLTGNVAGQPPYKGTLGHAGWEATKQELPEWTGSPQTATVIAPAEVEVNEE